jgi:subtilisin family serine protease
MNKVKTGLIIIILALLLFLRLISDTKLALASTSIGNLKTSLSLEGLLYRKVIADNASEQDVKNFENRGCTIRYKLKNAVSFKCPRILKPQLFGPQLPSTREMRMFYIMDAESNYQVRVYNVWQQGLTGKGIKIAILDTGFDFTHPELKNSYVGGYDYINNDDVPEDENGHGTHVAGIITGDGIDQRAKGVAPDVKIYMFKVCDAFRQCPEDAMMAAMQSVVVTDARIMSMSIGRNPGTIDENCDWDPLAVEVNKVADTGIIPIIAAGNDGKTVAISGCASKAIAVGAVDKNDNVAVFSGRGKALDIVAPGVGIYSSVIGGYDSWNGTSMATPHVSAIIALLLQYKPDLMDQEIRQILYDTTSPVDKCYQSSLFGDQEVECNGQMTGAGIINAYHSFLAAKCNCF